MIGKIFNKWKVIEYSHTKNKRKYWRCECECGEIKVVREDSLLSSGSKSCGCLKSIKNKENFKKTNRYVESEDFIIGFDGKEMPFIIDMDDYEKVKDYCWNVKGNGYVSGTIDGKEISIHRFILGIKDPKIEVDHINRKKNDNRKTNLRLSSRKENSRNKSLLLNNKSGVTGVCFSRNKWQAYIMIDGYQKYIGKYENIEDAIYARLKEEKSIFGDFSPQKHLFKKYGL